MAQFGSAWLSSAETVQIANPTFLSSFISYGCNFFNKLINYHQMKHLNDILLSKTWICSTAMSAFKINFDTFFLTSQSEMLLKGLQVYSQTTCYNGPSLLHHFKDQPTYPVPFLLNGALHWIKVWAQASRIPLIKLKMLNVHCSKSPESMNKGMSSRLGFFAFRCPLHSYIYSKVCIFLSIAFQVP